LVRAGLPSAAGHRTRSGLEMVTPATTSFDLPRVPPGMASWGGAETLPVSLRRSGRGLRVLGHLEGGLVLTQALVGRLTQGARVGVAAVFDLGDEGGRDPVDGLARRGRAARGALADEGAVFGLRRLQRREQGLEQGLGVARADAAEVAQALALFPVDVLDADDEGAEAVALGRPAADDDLVPAAAFGLEPGGRPAAMIGGVQRLGDDALEVHAAGAVQHGLAGGGEMVDVADALAGRGRDAVDPGPQSRLAVRQGQAAQILVAVEQQVEGEIDQVAGVAVRDRRLKGREVGHMVFGQGAQLAVDDAVGPMGRVLGVDREFGRPVEALAGAQDGLAAADADLDAVAVELDLMGPAGAARGVVGDLAQLDGDEGGRFCGGAGGGFRRPGFGRGLAGRRLRGFRARRSPGDLGHGAARGDGGVDLHIGVALAFDRVFVALLDEQPVAAFRGFATVGAEADQGPFSLQPFAVQDHLDLALPEGRIEVGLLRLPGSAVPHLHRAGAVVAGGDGALEGSVIERVVLDLDGEAFDEGVAGRGLGHGPGLEHAVDLDAEVVVEARRGVALDQIGQGGRLRLALAAGRLGGVGEIALRLIGLEFAAGCHGG